MRQMLDIFSGNARRDAKYATDVFAAHHRRGEAARFFCCNFVRSQTNEQSTMNEQPNVSRNKVARSNSYEKYKLFCFKFKNTFFMCKEWCSFRAQQWRCWWDSSHSIIKRTTLYLLILEQPIEGARQNFLEALVFFHLVLCPPLAGAGFERGRENTVL